MAKYQFFFRLSRKEKIQRIVTFLAVILGNISLAFGTAIFLTKLNIVSGGLSGIGIIVQSFIPEGTTFLNGQIIDLVVFVLTWLLWLVGLIFVDKEFAIKTLASSIIYPLALSLFLRIPAFMTLSEQIAFFPNGPDAVVSTGNLLLCASFGGVFVGFGVALNFFGGGSSGGVDVLIKIFNKYFGIKESIVSFLIDAIIIVCGMFIIRDNVVPALCGMICAFITALVIEAVYVSSMSAYQLDIISNKWEEISRFVQDELGRGATILNVKGGYKGEERVMLRVVIDRLQFTKLRIFIAKTDPSAFFTYTQTNATFGEGFKKNITRTRKNKDGK